MFFDEDEDAREYKLSGNVGFSFAEIERNEASKSISALVDLDQKLYADSDPVIPIPVNDDRDAIIDGYRRYESFGYDAHNDAVEDSEILQWRRAFPYLQVVGTKIDISGHKSRSHFQNLDDMPQTVNMENFLETVMAREAPQLAVQGRRIEIATAIDTRTGMYTNELNQLPTMSCSDGSSTLTAGENEEEEEEGEYLARDGVLEEILAIHCDDSEDNHNASDLASRASAGVSQYRYGDCASSSSAAAVAVDKTNGCPSPSVTQREEVVASLFAMLWPDVVHALRPLVQKVVETIHSNPEILQRLNDMHLEEEEGGKRQGDYGSDTGGNDGDFCYTFDDDDGACDGGDTNLNDSGW